LRGEKGKRRLANHPVSNRAKTKKKLLVFPNEKGVLGDVKEAHRPLGGKAHLRGGGRTPGYCAINDVDKKKREGRYWGGKEGGKGRALKRGGRPSETRLYFNGHRRKKGSKPERGERRTFSLPRLHSMEKELVTTLPKKRGGGEKPSPFYREAGGTRLSKRRGFVERKRKGDPFSYYPAKGEKTERLPIYGRLKGKTKGKVLLAAMWKGKTSAMKGAKRSEEYVCLTRLGGRERPVGVPIDERSQPKGKHPSDANVGDKEGDSINPR